MSYQVIVDWAPAYELVVSLHAYMSVQSHRLQEQGERWAAAVAQQLRPGLVRTLAAQESPVCLRTLGLLIHQVRGERSADSFLRWLAGVAPGELYERLSPHAPPGGLPLWSNLGALRDQYLEWLAPWYEEYFRHLDPAVTDWLRARSGALGLLSRQVSGPAVVEHATGGYEVEPRPGIGWVLLVPQYHKRPLSVHFPAREYEAFFCPVEDMPAVDGAPGPGLMRLTRAVADESRLQILRILSRGPFTFTEVVQQTGLTKGTVHKHLSALKGAGLVRSHFRDGAVVAYSLRPAAFSRLAGQLEGYMGS